MKALSAIHAREAIAEAELADTKLLEAEMHVGKVIYVVRASSYQALSPKPTWAPIVAEISGGEDDYISNWFKFQNFFNSSSLCLPPKAEFLKLSWTNNLDLNLCYFVNFFLHLNVCSSVLKHLIWVLYTLSAQSMFISCLVQFKAWGEYWILNSYSLFVLTNLSNNSNGQD